MARLRKNLSRRNFKRTHYPLAEMLAEPADQRRAYLACITAAHGSTCTAPFPVELAGCTFDPYPVGR